MLWSMVIKPQTKYHLEDHVAREVILHISKTTLDINSAPFALRDENTSLLMDYYNDYEKNFFDKVILCNLSKENSQEDLDLDVDPRDLKLVTLYSNNQATIFISLDTPKGKHFSEERSRSMADTIKAVIAS